VGVASFVDEAIRAGDGAGPCQSRSLNQHTLEFWICLPAS
jgi:hypothetical protein